MWEDLDAWLVLLSLLVTAVALGLWLTKAGDDWMHSQIDHDGLADNPPPMPPRAHTDSHS